MLGRSGFGILRQMNTEVVINVLRRLQERCLSAALCLLPPHGGRSELGILRQMDTEVGIHVLPLSLWDTEGFND